MKLTPEMKAHIDSLSYDRLLTKWRLAPDGDPWFQNATGQYWSDRMAQLRPAGECRTVAAAKIIGCF
jgi:hypothetical protein